jgi:hypothetical protein
MLVRENSLPDYDNLQDLFMSKSQRKQQKGLAALPQQLEVDEEEEEEGEYEVEDQVEGGSLIAAIFGIIKGTIGPAILFLPRGFKQAGWACAVPALCFATFSYIYSAHRLLECWKVEDARQRFLVERMGEIQSLFDNHHRHLQQQQQQQQQGTGDNHHNDKFDPSKNTSDPSMFAAFSPKLLTYPELARRAFGSYAVMIEFGIAAMQFGKIHYILSRCVVFGKTWNTIFSNLLCKLFNLYRGVPDLSHLCSG